MQTSFLQSAIKQFEYYKLLGERTFAQLSDEQLCWRYNEESNSIATIVQHLSGNMRSRWTDFLTSDGEKPWRDRDAEFENNKLSKDDILRLWNEGWDIFLNTLRKLGEDDLPTIIYIRSEAHTAMDAINRQLAHYPYHVGQIVMISKMCASSWTSLSIPRAASRTFNEQKFSAGKTSPGH